MNIIVHIELGNFSIIKRQVHMAQSFLRKDFPENKSELNIIHLLAKIARATETHDNDALADLSFAVSKAVALKNIGRKTYITDWLKSKLKL
jgi:hypothetical protein